VEIILENGAAKIVKTNSPRESVLATQRWVDSENSNIMSVDGKMVVCLCSECFYPLGHDDFIGVNSFLDNVCRECYYADEQ